MKKRVNNNDDLCAKADMSVAVSLTLTVVYVPSWYHATRIYVWSLTVIMDLITFDDHLGVKYTSQIEPFTHIINHIGIDKLFISLKSDTFGIMIDSHENF